MLQKVQPIFEKHYVEKITTKKFFRDFLNEVVTFQYSILKEWSMFNFLKCRSRIYYFI